MENCGIYSYTFLLHKIHFLTNVMPSLKPIHIISHYKIPQCINASPCIFFQGMMLPVLRFSEGMMGAE